MFKIVKNLAMAVVIAGSLASQAGNLAVNGDFTSNLTVGSGNWYQLGVGASGGDGKDFNVTIGEGWTLEIENAAYEVIIGQNMAGTSILNIEGTMKYTGTNKTFWIGNNLATSIGIVNLNGGTLDASIIDNPDNSRNDTNSIIFGRSGAKGYLNINAGTAIFGSKIIWGTGTGAINFSEDSTGTLSITGADKNYYEGLFDESKLNRLSSSGTFDEQFSVVGSTISVVAVPEPSSFILAMLGLGTLLARRRRK